MHLLIDAILAHGGKPHDLHDLWRTWGLEPGVLLSLALAAWLYAQGVWRMWRAAGIGHGIRRWEVSAFAGGWLALFIALVSPLHPWGRVLFSAHMTQHEILMLAAAPLLVLGRPLIAFLRALPGPWARWIAGVAGVAWWMAVWRAITNPLAAWLIHGLALWVWHIPALFQATLDNDLVHSFQHLSFLLSALLFWWAIIQRRPGVRSYGIGVLFMFTTALHSGLLGVLIACAGRLWYPQYVGLTRSWGLTPLQDQQLGGLIMWIPAGVVYIIAGLALFAGWLRESEQRLLRASAMAAAAAPLAAVAILLLPFLAGCEGSESRRRQAAALTGGDPDRGQAFLRVNGCVACHSIPGVHSARGLVGPPLDGIGQRAYIAGVVENTPRNMIRFLQNSPAVDPRTAMPNLHLSDADARDIAAFLYTLR